MLLTQIDQDLKSALKDKNELVVSSLRNLKAAIKNAEIEKKTALSDDEVLKVLAKKVKQHKDSIESFQAGNRPDLVAHEQAQLQVLARFMPSQMEESELNKIVDEVITRLQPGEADFGKVMKEVVGQVKGRADGSVISKLVRLRLSIP